MAVRFPLVIVNGEYQVLQSGDTLGGAASSSTQVAQQADAALVPGNVVYTTTNDHVNLAQANAAGTSKPLGVSVGSVASGASGSIQTDGILSLTTAQWDAAAGTTGGLVAGTTYFLDPANAGRWTSTPPTSSGQYLVQLGQALSSTEMDVRIQKRILL